MNDYILKITIEGHSYSVTKNGPLDILAILARNEKPDIRGILAQARGAGFGYDSKSRVVFYTLPETEAVAHYYRSEWGAETEIIDVTKLIDDHFASRSNHPQ